LNAPHSGNFRLKFPDFIAVHESLHGPERRLPRNSITSGIGDRAEMPGLRSKGRC
jgi:hypothetical protein